MKQDAIEAMLNASPFVPFNLHLSDGRTIKIEHPDFVWTFKNRITIGIRSGEGRRVDREEKIALLHIVSVEEAA